jgi:hypothetical protein
VAVQGCPITSIGIVVAALTRNRSTVLNDLQVDEPQFQRDIDGLVKGACAVAARGRK